ncbi:hypothetical protein ABC733_06580 [Mangrovibacter sp. SLW1]
MTNEGQHYDQEETDMILFAGSKPFMNSLQYNVCFIDSKFNPDFLAGDCMNIAFQLGKEPDVRKGHIVDWSYDGQVDKVKILDSTLLYVKGIRARTYVVQFLEKDADDVFISDNNRID